MENIIIEAKDYRDARIKADAMEPECGHFLLYVGIITGCDKALYEFKPTARIGGHA